MTCARVMRGINSMAKAWTPAPGEGLQGLGLAIGVHDGEHGGAGIDAGERGGARDGARRSTTSASGDGRGRVGGDGRAGLLEIGVGQARALAGAGLNDDLGRRGPTSFLTVSGVAATRASLAAVSAGTAIRMNNSMRARAGARRVSEIARRGAAIAGGSEREEGQKQDEPDDPRSFPI